MIAIENFIDIALVNDSKTYQSDFEKINLTVKDPLGDVTVENEEPKLFRLKEMVFAEPLSLSLNINKDKASSKKIIFLDNVVTSDSNFKKDEYQFALTESDTTSSKCQQPNCNRSFSSLILLKAHVRKVHFADRSKYECYTCDAAFPQKYLLKRHLTVHESLKNECPVCHKKLSTRTNMTLHIRGHEKKRLHTCPECEKSFIRKVTMENHIRYIHRPDSLKCGRCDITFQRRIDHKRHLETHIEWREIACEICGKMFSTLAALGAHKVKKHEMNNAASEDS